MIFTKTKLEDVYINDLFSLMNPQKEKYLSEDIVDSFKERLDAISINEYAKIVKSIDLSSYKPDKRFIDNSPHLWYDKYNRITKIINSLNEYEEFLYDNDDNITGKKIGIINSDNENVVPIEETISYIYDEYGNISIIIINGSNLKTYNFVYDDFNYLTKVYFNNDLMIEYEYLYKNNIIYYFYP